MSNLPPGVTDSMIPGNTPEDAAYEQFCEDLTTHLIAADVDTTTQEFEVLAERLYIARRATYDAGYRDGAAEEKMSAAQVHDEQREQREAAATRLAMLAAEFGYRQCESGESLGAALRNTALMLTGDLPTA